MTPTSLRTLLEALIQKLRGCNVSSDADVGSRRGPVERSARRMEAADPPAAPALACLSMKKAAIG